MFNYFLPGVTKEQVAPDDRIDREKLYPVGLREALADVHKVPAHATVANVQRGPSGVGGVVIAPVLKHRGPPSVIYDGKLQVWEPAAGGEYFIGVLASQFDGQQPVVPQDLERWESVGGVDVLDDGGRAWSVPIARAPHRGSPYGFLPQSYTLDPDTGDVAEHLVPSYGWLWELSGIVRDWYLSQQEPPDDATPEEKAKHAPRPFKELVRHTVKLLGVNYRVGVAELNLLHKMGVALLTQRTVHLVCRSSYGWETLEQARKKKHGQRFFASSEFIALSNWRKHPDRCPWYRPSRGALEAAVILDELDRPQEHHEHLHLNR
jgi:hypothetical protein